MYKLKVKIGTRTGRIVAALIGRTSGCGVTLPSHNARPHRSRGIPQSLKKPSIFSVSDFAKKYEKIMKSPIIADDLKQPICDILAKEMMTTDQLLAIDDETVKKRLFPDKMGLQLAVLDWKRKQTPSSPHESNQPEILPFYANKLHSAAQSGDLSTIRTIFKEIDSPSLLKQLVEHRNEENCDNTPVMDAAERGHLAVVEFLVREHGADLYAQDSHELGSMAIHLAARDGHHDVVAFLLSQKPDLLEAKDNLNDTPLCMAALNGQLAVVELLVGAKHQANVEARGQFGRTCLQMAAEEGHASIVRYLVENSKASVDARDATDDENMAIHLAARDGHIEVVSYLLQVKPELLEAKTKSGMTPLSFAKATNKIDIVAFLEWKGAKN